MSKIHEESEKLALKAKNRGFAGKRLSLKEMEKLAKKFLMEKAL